MLTTAQYWIDKLSLRPHREGGFYRETYRSALQIPTQTGVRSASTSIYFLLEAKDFSALHRLRSDEVWHFYAGSSVIVHVIDQVGAASEIKLGSDPDEVFQAVVKAGHWFGSRLRDGKSFALLGCTVAPGFDSVDFELGKRRELLGAFPQHAEVIKSLTRG